jgi:translation initiation factor IF-2
MNVTELARRLKMNTKDLLDKLPELGFDIGKRAIKIDANLVDKIIVAVEADRRQQRLLAEEEKIKEVKLDQDKVAEQPEVAKSVKIPEVIIVKDLAEKMGLPVTKLIAELMKNGVMASLNERIDFATASIIAEDLGYKAEIMSEEEVLELEGGESDKKLKEILESRQSDNLQPRPPVVVVMGHVDHGKTKLLDAIRETQVAEGESGGITQHIGAYQARAKGRLITFLDTPGHEAFKSMRSRGSKIADVAIIVVAADDGLQPQTLEVINLVQKEKLPFIIAINKIDKEGADIERVKKELSEINLIPEDWGGKTICVPISAKQKQNIKELLDMVLLVADLEEFKADPTIPAVGTIIESHIDKGEGPVATVLVQAGILKPGDMVAVGEVAGRVRALKDFMGQNVSMALPSTPVKILGLKATPLVGDILEATADRKKIKDLLKQASYKKAALPKAVKSVTESEDEDKAVPALNLVLKADVLGSLEALSESLEKFDDPEVKLKIIKKGLGNVSDVDVLAAEAAKGLVIAFNVKQMPSAEEQAREKGVEVLSYEVIYKLLEEIEERLKLLLKPELTRTELGTIKVMAIFKTDKKEMIVGGKITAGLVKSDTKAKVVRDGETVDFGTLAELRAGKEIVSEAVAGESCGLKYLGNPVIKEGDILEIYQEETKARKLKKKN